MSGKSFEIDKWQVWDAFQVVRGNRGAAGVDGVSVEEFEKDLKNNLYKIWNRMSSGTYFPPAVRAVEIPKPHGGGTRMLGVPTVADRVAQTVAAKALELVVEPVFHQDSYGYRPGRSQLDAVGLCRRRCWRYDWVIDLDIKEFFGTVPHREIVVAVEKHAPARWVSLYVQRWLTAPIRQSDGSTVIPEKGTPQGSAISPVLANLFLHYAFDTWIAREFPGVVFERYCDDVVVHCRSEQRAREVLTAIVTRLAGFGLEVHPGKTKIVYCKDDNRGGSSMHERFTFLGYDFRARSAKNEHGQLFMNFLPAVSKDAMVAMGKQVRSWHLGRRVTFMWKDLARWINPIVAGWLNYYGRYRAFMLNPLLYRINQQLVRWLTQKYKRFRRRQRKAWKALAEIAQAYPRLFSHWRHVTPDGRAIRAV
ncbi:RNA-directed DNA polymerase [Kibdelosporangium banguiense]|uniref:RNA-directed DNA polymerase n=1 Tax=Kibdelosporangium banguiense TaxID=1365924 RepID=A0ABS4TBZ8_9PSEU|nr:group II intron reverse transcriptase/maturase [Kibdelosporangium banguiense]MBP2321681.1 RNA-directed DNA polymerase [Kibdelosporangium banguiense]MBP2321943.1 RNA-directed DNA polymerase [Kibdelosporangium banguiense]